MKIYLYGQDDGLSITSLPLEKEGLFSIAATHNGGENSRILDIEGNGVEWTAYSTAYGTIESDNICFDELVLSEGKYFSILHSGKKYCILCKNESTHVSRDVRLFSFSEGTSFTVGNTSCDVACNHPMLFNDCLMFQKMNHQIHLKVSNTTNGAYLNYHPVNDAIIHPGDIVDIFGLRLLFTDEMVAINAHSVPFTINSALRPMIQCSTLHEERRFNKHLLPDTDKPYNRSPRIANPDQEVAVTIDPVPPSGEKEEMPLIFSVGSSAFMSISSIMMAMNSVTNAQAIGAPITSVLPSVFMAGGMFFGSMLMPVFARKYTDKRNREKEETRKRKYLSYINNSEAEIISIGNRQKEILEKAYPSPEKLMREARKSESDLWNHMPFHHDFLRLRLGTAKLTPAISIKFPSFSFSVDEDELRTAVEKLEAAEHYIDNTPLMLSLKKEGILGIIAESYQERMDYLKGLLIQLCVHHSYKELKLVLIYNQDEETEWEFARWFPHVWSDNREFRSIGTEKDSMRNISAYIDAICPINDRFTESNDSMCVVVLADSYLAEQCFSLTERMKHIEKSNMRVIAIAGEANELPKECKSVIVLEGNKGVLNKDIEKLGKPTLFNIDPIPTEMMRPFVSDLFNTHLADEQSDGKLVDLLTLFDMLRCGNVEQINAPVRWKNSNPVKTLAAPVGIDKYGSLLSLDIHQNAHGPHGLIAGMTGSGKSEFIITYLLSMAINYSPLEVGFILIDYKGGGMSDTLAGLPHVVGVIDNLGGSQGIHRALVSIKSEILRRQIVFKEISEKKHVSNMDIYKYQAMYRNGELNEPMQHLILVSDEFAELKEQESDFMDDIVSMARIGRSLGIHLILATQKPSGVVSPQIASNARFHVCLKVQDKSDSMEMLGRPEAALLTKTGRFYLQVGFNEIFSLGQSAWSGALSTPKPRYIEEPDNSFEMINDLGYTVMKARPSGNERAFGQEKQVDAVVAYLRKAAMEENAVPEKSWKPALEPEILLDEIEKSFSPTFEYYKIDPVIALVDDPKHQDQYPLQMNFTEKGNAIVYGFAGSGKQEIINAVLYSLCKHHTANELQIYCLDFASEACKMFASMPQIGDVIVSGEDEKISNFVNMITEEMNRRRKILSVFGGNIDLYRKEENAHLPNILIIVENYTAFSEAYDNLEESMYRLIREGNRFGVYFLITSISTTGIRYRLLQNFKQILCLQLTDKLDYFNLLGKTEGTEPLNRLGSGIYNNDGVKEFQTGFIFPVDVTDGYQRVQELSHKIAAKWNQPRAPRVPVLPRNVCIEDVCDVPAKIMMNAVPVGINKSTMLPHIRDFTEQYITPILFSVLPEIPYLQMLCEMLSQNKEREVIVFDVGGMLDHSPHHSYRLVADLKEAEQTITALYGLNVKRHNQKKEAEENGLTLTDYHEVVMLFINLKDLYDKLNQNELISSTLDTILLMGRSDLKMYALFLQESKYISYLNNHIWFEKYPDRDGLWLGDGIQMQSVLKVDHLKRESVVSEQFGYVVRRGKANMIKLIEGRKGNER